MERNTVTVCFEEGLYSRSCLVSDFNWITAPGAFPLKCSARTRYRQPERECVAEGVGASVRLTFASPQRAIATGQAAVLYDGDKVLGGGTINAVYEEV